MAGKKLVIVESPAKAKTINKILGDDYIVKSSMGHVRDLPTSSLGVDVKNAFKPKYVVVKGRKKIIDELKKVAKTCDTVYLAPDPDREGEAIAWHLQAILSQANKKLEFFRVQYNEITPRAVRKAFENPGELDLHRVDAQQARRILDRLVGYTVSPMLWRRMQAGLSAGRVQSVALRLVCEREEEITSFVPEEYWILGATVRKRVEPLSPFNVKLLRIDGEKADVKSGDQAAVVKADVEGREFRVTGVAVKTINKKPAPPFITSTLQQAASSYCGYSPKRTMSIAQKLYEGMDLGEGPVGLITYMRTDSFSLANEAVTACREHIVSQFGDEYCPDTPNAYKSRSNAQEAHEAIRPTDVSRTPESLEKVLSSEEARLYELIWRRFVACQMTPARIEQRTAKVVAAPPPGKETEYLFQASASQVQFPGYMKVASAAVRKAEAEAEAEANGEEQAQELPPLTEGEGLDCLDWLEERKETQPPPRFSEASLVRALEDNGVGRPSTYAQTVSTLYQRRYMAAKKKTLTPSELGMQVFKLLVSNLDELFNVKFTASMEESLDEVEKGNVDWTEMLAAFHVKFKEWMAGTRSPAADRTTVERLLTALEGVETWAPEVKKGKRTYSDEGFVSSIGKQLKDGAREITERQLTTLLKISSYYREQVSDIEDIIRDTGHGDILDQVDMQPPRESSLKKFEVLATVDLDESARSFVDSLRSQVQGGRCLTEAQVRALNNVVLANASQVANFESIKGQLDVGRSEIAEDHESGVLIGGLGGVTRWHPPTVHRKRTYNDQAFYDSLVQHFQRKGFLSVRQRAALKRMVERYRDQIPDYAEIVEKCGMRQPAS